MLPHRLAVACASTLRPVGAPLEVVGAPLDVVGHGFGLERFIEEPLQLNNGLALAPDRPGHSVVLDFEALETHRHTT